MSARASQVLPSLLAAIELDGAKHVTPGQSPTGPVAVPASPP